MALPNLPAKVRSASLLSKDKVTVVQNGDKLVISVPERYHHQVDTVVELKLDNSAMQVTPVTIVEQNPETHPPRAAATPNDKEAK